MEIELGTALIHTERAAGGTGSLFVGAACPPPAGCWGVLQHLHKNVSDNGPVILKISAMLRNQVLYWYCL